MKAVDADELKRRLDAGAELVLVDARHPRSFEKAHLPGALSGMSDHIVERASTLAPDRAAAVVTYCGSPACRRSRRAAERLEGLGYADVAEFAGGVEEWRRRGYELVAE